VQVGSEHAGHRRNARVARSSRCAAGTPIATPVTPATKRVISHNVR
jgi:hypothetical protein